MNIKYHYLFGTTFVTHFSARKLFIFFIFNFRSEKIFDMADILDIVFDNERHLGRQLQDHLFTQWRRFREEIQISENFEFRKYYLITGAVGLTLTGVFLTNY